jgi:hypothetical protein
LEHHAENARVGIQKTSYDNANITPKERVR